MREDGQGAKWKVGADIGGTFTDIIAISPSGAIWTKKLLSTPDDFSRAIIEGLKRLAQQTNEFPGGIDLIVHATTVATNAVLERKGAKTALVTTEGFRDVLEIGRLRVPVLYDVGWEKPVPLVRRRFRYEVKERMNADGTTHAPVDRDSVERALDEIAGHGIESVAVSLLNSYVNGAHEHELRAAFNRRFPDLDLTLSSELLPEIREFERTSTTVVNAYIKPIVRRYLQALRDGLDAEGFRCPVYIMQSNGGMMSLERTAELPVNMLESGPAAGIIGAQYVAVKTDHPNVISFDMGGTTAKASIIEDGQLSRSAEFEVGGSLSASSHMLKGGGYLIRLPVIDMAEVGAGGGSIARLDEGGSLRVGPHSAGAQPGPVCYGLGGKLPTITDANLVLGYLSPEGLAGGDYKLDLEAARQAIREQIAEPGGMELETAAFAIHTVANATMIRAVRAVSVERGRDVRDFVTIAFGGNGPVHAAQIARSLGMRKVLVPQVPGLFSAFGLLVSDVEQHDVQSVVRLFADVQPRELDDIWSSLAQKAVERLRGEGYTEQDIVVERLADVRYRGQHTELTITASAPFTQQSLGELQTRFVQEHTKLFGQPGMGRLEIVSVRIVARVRTQKTEPAAGGIQPLSKTYRQAYFGPQYGWCDTLVVRRDMLSDEPLNGPVIVQEYDSTIVAPPNTKLTRDVFGNIIIELEGSEA